MVRSVECFTWTDENGKFTSDDFRYRVSKLLRNQEHLLIILDMKAYSETAEYDQTRIITEACRVLNETDPDKKIAVLIDMNGDIKITERLRDGLISADRMRSNILPVVSWKYGEDRSSVIMSLAYCPETADEFLCVSTFTAAANWTIG